MLVSTAGMPTMMITFVHLHVFQLEYHCFTGFSFHVHTNLPTYKQKQRGKTRDNCRVGEFDSPQKLRSFHSGPHFIPIMDTPFDAWFDQIDNTLDFTFTGELLSDWNPMHPEEASPSILPPPPWKLTQITCETHPIMYEQYETLQTFIVPSKPGAESTHSGTVAKAASREMNQGILHYVQCRFLTKVEENSFMVKDGMTCRQVTTWFHYRTQRLIAPMRSLQQNELQQPILSRLTAFGVTVPFSLTQTNQE
jgi:hypothetical protein